MRLIRQRDVGLAASLFSTLSTAITLADFTPTTDGLEGQCLKVYGETIGGCQSSDFQTGAKCSTSCVNGLADLQTQVQTACAGSGAPEDSIIGVGLGGNLLSSLCPNTAVVTSTSQSSAAVIGQSTMVASGTASTGGILTDTATQPTASATEVLTSSTTSYSLVPSSLQSSAQSSGFIATDTNSAPAAASTSAASATLRTTASTTTDSASSQTSFSDSGGGSPFDPQGSAPSLSISSLGILLSALTTSLSLCYALL